MDYCKLYFLITIIDIILAIYAAEDNFSTQNKNIGGDETANLMEKNWFLQTLYKKAEIIENKNCSLDVIYYLQEIENLSPWALQMFDATAKFPSGILDGNLRHLGHFDQCLRAKAIPNESNEKSEMVVGINPRFNGLYCLVTVNFDLEDSITQDAHHVKHSLLYKLNFILDEMMLGRRKLEDRQKKMSSMEHMPVIPIFSLSEWAVCLPSTCQAKDIQDYLNSILTTVLQQIRPSPLQVTLQVNREACVSHSIEEPSQNGLFKTNNSFLYASNTEC